MSGPLSPNSWQYRGLNAINPGLSYLSDGLIELVKAGHPVVAGAADLQYSNGLNRFAKAYPGSLHPVRHFRAEHGLGGGGHGHVRADAVRRHLCLVPRTALLRADPHGRGLLRSAGAPDRPSHRHLARLLRHLASRDRGHRRPCARSPIWPSCRHADGPQLVAAIRASATYDKPIYFRIGRGPRSDRLRERHGVRVRQGRRASAQGEELTIIACGMARASAHWKLPRSFNAAGRSVGVIDMASIKPIDRGAILRAAARSQAHDDGGGAQRPRRSRIGGGRSAVRRGRGA